MSSEKASVRGATASMKPKNSTRTTKVKTSISLEIEQIKAVAEKK
jgi:hypothetical protein